MKISTGWIALPLLLALGACAGDAEDADVATVDTGAEVATPATEPGITPEPTTGMGAMAQTAMLQPLQDSGVSGEATLTDRGDQTEVMVRLTGASTGGTHPGHIHSGDCQNIGGVEQALDPISVDATGTGTMTTTVPIPPMTAMDGQHVIVYHGDGGAPITCAEIPMHTM